MICRTIKYLSDLHTHPRNCYTERILLTVDEKTDQRRIVMCMCVNVFLFYIMLKQVHKVVISLCKALPSDNVIELIHILKDLVFKNILKVVL